MTANTKFVIKELHGGLYFSRIEKLVVYAYPDECIVHYSKPEYAIKYDTKEEAEMRASQLCFNYPVNMYFKGKMKYVVEQYDHQT